MSAWPVLNLVIVQFANVHSIAQVDVSGYIERYRSGLFTDLVP
jgi:hypothetical protein